MVRRWSYISVKPNNFNLLQYSSDNCLTTYYNFKTFKKTTFFRKFNSALSLHWRKKNIRRKRHTNLINITSIVYMWIKSYIFMRRLAKYSQLHGILKFSRAVSSWSLLQKNFYNFGYTSGAILSRLNNKSQKFILSPSASLLTDKHTNYTGMNSIFSSNHYFYEHVSNLTLLPLNIFLTKTWSQLIIKVLVTLRSIIILCSLLCLLYAIRKYSF